MTTRAYTTLMRSHTDRVLHMSQDVFRRHMATISADHTIRVWSQDNGQQVEFPTLLVKICFIKLFATDKEAQIQERCLLPWTM